MLARQTNFKQTFLIHNELYMLFCLVFIPYVVINVSSLHILIRSSTLYTEILILITIV